MQQPQQPSASGHYGVPEVPQFVGGRSSHGHMLGISHDMPHHEPPQSQHLQQPQLLQQSHSQPPQQQSVNPQVKTDSITEIQSSAATRPIPRTTDGFEQMVPNSAFGDDEVLAAAEDGDRGSVGSRWPRQETLALLKIRSEMDASFRDASLKGPLWEEISRKLADLGYQRSAKKCKEKFENVQKYYKRTKDGRAGRQDGKSYRFFSQLEALHNHHNNNSNNNLHNSSSSIGNNTNNARNNHSHALSSGAGAPVRPQPPAPIVLTNNNNAGAGAGASVTAGELNINSGAATNAIVLKQSADYSAGNLSFSSESSEDEEFEEQTDSRKRKRGSSTTEKMMLFFEQLIKQVMERQESMQQKFLETIEKREQDRMIREEAWKRQEMARLNREHEIMAQERALAASRDTAFIAFFQKITGQTLQVPVMAPVAQSTTTLNNTVPLPTHETHPAREVVTTPHQRDTTQDVNVDQMELTFDPNSSRWPKPEVHALIKLRTGLEPRYQDAGPKGPLWEEISAGMARLGYSRSSKRCKEKWENINKYYKKVKESNKKRPEDAKTCPYFHQLEQLYKKKVFGNAGKQEHPNQDDARIEQLPAGGNNNSDRTERQSTDGILVIVPPPGSSSDVKNSNSNPNNNGPPILSSSGAMQATFFTNPENGTGADQRALKKPEGPVMDVMDMDDMQSAPQHQQQSVVDDYDDDKMDAEEEDSENNSDQEHHNIIPIPTIATNDRQPTMVVDHLPFAEFVHESRTSTTAASSFMAMVHRFAPAEAPEFKTSKA